ncbi:MAG: Zinc-specific metallo-regulatory protein [Turneriella sp.]|nr:Zinc-specific metallo-regulatory protein [Turneriella sp.]
MSKFPFIHTMRDWQRQTKQREALREIFLTSERPLTIANLVALAHEKHIKIGQATVYRTVNALLKIGEIKSVQIPGNDALYEKAHLNHHHHFKCEKVYDLPGCPEGIDFQKFVPKKFKLIAHDFTFYGICASCA